MHTLQGSVEQTGENYWLVNGNLIYLDQETHLEDGIVIGAEITVIYRIEQNGTFTAIEIRRSESSGELEEIVVEETPERTNEGTDQGSTIDTPSEKEETEEGAEHPEQEETPEPTEVHADPN